MGNQTSAPAAPLPPLPPRYAELLRAATPGSPRLNHRALLIQAHQAQLLRELKRTPPAMPSPQSTRPEGRSNGLPLFPPSAPLWTNPTSNLGIFHPAAARPNQAPVPALPPASYATPSTKLSQLRIPPPASYHAPSLTPPAGPPHLARPSLRIEAITRASHFPDTPQSQPPRPESPRLRPRPEARGWPPSTPSPRAPFQSSRPALPPSRLAPSVPPPSLHPPPPASPPVHTATKPSPVTIGDFFAAALSNFRDFFLAGITTTTTSRAARDPRAAPPGSDTPAAAPPAAPRWSSAGQRAQQATASAVSQPRLKVEVLERAIRSRRTGVHVRDLFRS